jgi:hypothetical protein
MFKPVMFAGALLAVSGTAVADAIDVNVSNDTLEAMWTTNIRTAEFSAGGLYNEDKEDWFAAASLLAKGELGDKNNRMDGGLGGKVYGASIGSKDVLALGLGGQFRIFPGNSPFGIGAHLYYAPGVLTFIDGENFWEFSLRGEYQFVKDTASAYIGYRKVRYELEGGTKDDIDRGFLAGIRISY